MESSNDRNNLLQTLKQLYSRIMVLHAEDRARSSRNHSNTSGTQNIALPLSVCIDKLAAKAVNADSTPVDASNSQIPEFENHSHDHAPFSQDTSPRVELGELSAHLKDSHKYPGASLGTGDKLMQSTWEHFHASIRLARQGNVEAAKLHADLTRNALNEAAHYLSEQEYSRFSKDVMNAVEDVNAQI